MEEDKKCNEQERKYDDVNGEENSINKREESYSENSQESELEMNKVTGSDGEGTKEQNKPTDEDRVVTIGCSETEENKDDVLVKNAAGGTEVVQNKEELHARNERKKETHDSKKDYKEKTVNVDEGKESEVSNEASKKIEGDTPDKSEQGSIASSNYQMKQEQEQEFEKCRKSEEEHTKKNILEQTSGGVNNNKDKETEATETSVHEHDSKEDKATITIRRDEVRTNISKVNENDSRNSVIEDKQKCESSSTEIFPRDENAETGALQNQKTSVEKEELNTGNEIFSELPKNGHEIKILNKEPTNGASSVSLTVKEGADDKENNALSNRPQVSEGTIIRIKQASQDKHDSNVSVNKTNDERLDQVKQIELSPDMNRNDEEKHTEVFDVETKKESPIISNTKSDVEEGERKDTEVSSELETQSKERPTETATIQGEPSVVEGCDVTNITDTEDRNNRAQKVHPSNKTIKPTIGNDEVGDKSHVKSSFTKESTKNESENKVIKLKDAKEFKEKNIVSEEKCENKDQKEELNCCSTDQGLNHKPVKVLKSSATEYEFKNKKDIGIKDCGNESSKSQEIRKESKEGGSSKHTDSLSEKKVDDKNKIRATHNTNLNHSNDKARDTVFKGTIIKRVKCEEKAQRSSITNSKSNQECNKSRSGSSISTEDVMKDQMKQLESKIHSSQEKSAQKSYRTFKQPAKQKQQEHKEIQNKQQSEKQEEKQTQQVHIREQNQIQKALQQNKSTQEKQDQQIQKIKNEHKPQTQQKQQTQKQPVQKCQLQEEKHSQEQEKSEASRNELDNHLKQKQLNQKEQVQNQEQQKTQQQQFEEKLPARKNQQQMIHKRKDEDKNNDPRKQEKRTKTEQEQHVKQEMKIDQQQEHQTIRKVQHELKNHKENFQKQSELNQQQQSKLEKRDIQLKQEQDYEQPENEDPKEQQKDKQLSQQQQQQKQQEESKQMQQSEDGEDDNAPGCGGIQGSSCPIYFGVKSYLHQFYDSTPMKNSQLYEEYIEEDDFEYTVDPVKNRGCRKCCRGFWFRAGLWGGINLILVGVITLLVGYLTPQREIVVGHQNNLEILDRSAIAFNRRLELCRLAGLAVFCCGGLVLLLTLLLSTFFHIGGHNNNNGHCCGENAYYGYVTTSLVEPFIPGHLHCSTVPPATGIKIPITEQIKSVQPSLWPDIATVKDGALVPHMP